jgi:hypothetical protein
VAQGSRPLDEDWGHATMMKPHAMRRRLATLGRPLVFFAINKTGSTSVWDWMDEHGVSYRLNRYREDEARKLRLIDDAARRGLESFTVVRNPWARAVSSWKWCMSRKGLAPCTFEEFLRIPFEHMTEQQRFHSSPQWRHIADAQGSIAHLAHVGRTECIERTVEWIAGTVGMTYEGDLRHLKQTSEAAKKYTAHYTPEARRLVESLFARDIELFGYEYGA